MKNFSVKILAVFLLFCCHAAAPAAEPLRPVVNLWWVEGGGARLADTYLSPLTYTGFHAAVGYCRAQAMRFNPTRWDNSLEFALQFDRAKSPAGNSAMLAATLNAAWGMTRRFELGRGFRLAVGGEARLHAGALYLARNSNNPAQAVAALTVGPLLRAQWIGRISRMSLRAGVNLSAPLLGAFFCPQYGELYYEIQLGNRNGLVHAVWPGSYRRLCGELYVELFRSASALRLAYRTDLLSSRANNITHRSLTHSLAVGVTCDFLSVNPKKHTDEAKIITALY